MSAKIHKLSTGDPSTLASYRKLCISMFGEDSKAVRYIDDLIAKSGEDEEVLADEVQMLNLLLAVETEYSH
jgi:hypothetical protein